MNAYNIPLANKILAHANAFSIDPVDLCDEVKELVLEILSVQNEEIKEEKKKKQKEETKPILEKEEEKEEK